MRGVHLEYFPLMVLGTGGYGDHWNWKEESDDSRARKYTRITGNSC